MHLEEITAGSALTGEPLYFTAVLYEGWEFWVAGPSGHTRNEVLLGLTGLHNVERVQVVKTYVPYLT